LVVHGRAFGVLGILAGLIAFTSQAWAGTVLITEQEASLPPERVAVGSRSITRGPRIELVQPGEKAYSPMHFQIRFQSFGGADINIGSLRAVYLKTPEVDITPRIARFAEPSGIDIPDAEVPVGEHYIRIEITDSEGRTRSSVFQLKIER
jgi:hypothetical protein